MGMVPALGVGRHEGTQTGQGNASAGGEVSPASQCDATLRLSSVLCPMEECPWPYNIPRSLCERLGPCAWEGWEMACGTHLAATVGLLCPQIPHVSKTPVYLQSTLCSLHSSCTPNIPSVLKPPVPPATKPLSTLGPPQTQPLQAAFPLIRLR